MGESRSAEPLFRSGSVAIFPPIRVILGNSSSPVVIEQLRLVDGDALVAGGAAERLCADTYRMTAVAPSRDQSLRVALLWAGSDAAAADRSAREVYGLVGVRAPRPEIVVPEPERTCDAMPYRAGTMGAS